MMKSYRAPASFQQGRYVPTKVLGSGTYGQVIRCRDVLAGNDVAVKVAQSDAAYRRSAMNEIHALTSLQGNRDSLSILDSFEDAGHICIVTELLDRNLFEVLRHRGFGPLGVDEVRQVAKHVLSALAALHNSGYIHCDIKPENIMLRCKTPTCSGNSSPVLGSLTSEGVGSASSIRTNGQIHYPTALAPGQELERSESNHHHNNANVHNQMWWNSNPIENLGACSGARGTKVVDGDSNANWAAQNSYPSGHSVYQQPLGDVGGEAVTIFHGGAAAVRGTVNSLEGLLGVFASAEAQLGKGNNTRVERNTPQGGYESEQNTHPHPFTSNPYCRTCLIDFGAVRRFAENTYYDVQSLWYRAPEVLCGLPYTTAIDAWSVGCVLFELFTGKPFFPGESPQQQLSLIVQHVGPPSRAALTMGSLARQFHIPVSYVPSNARRKHVRQWIVSSRHAGLERLRKHEMQKQQKTPAFSWNAGVRHKADAAGLSADGDVVFTAAPCEDRGGEAVSEEFELLVDLICDLLQPDEAQRLSCTQALRHPFLTNSPPCCTSTPSPYVATPTACFSPLATVVPQQIPCFITAAAAGSPVLMAGSPLSIQMECSPSSSFVVHRMQSSSTTSVPFGVAPAEPMMQVKMGIPPFGISQFAPPPQHQQQQQFHSYSTYPPAPSAEMCTATTDAASMMQCAHPVFTEVPHPVNLGGAPGFLPVDVTMHNALTSLYGSPITTTSIGQQPLHQSQKVLAGSPTYPAAGTLMQTQVPLHLAAAAASSGTDIGSSLASLVQPLGVPSYMFAASGSVPCIRDGQTEMHASVDVAPYMFCHFQPHATCAAVMSP